MMIGPVLNTIGLFVNLVGVFMLFRYGMPTYLRAGGGEMVTTNPTEEGVKLERRNGILGALALGLIVVGTGFQVAANFSPSK